MGGQRPIAAGNVVLTGRAPDLQCAPNFQLDRATAPDDVLRAKVSRVEVRLVVAEGAVGYLDTTISQGRVWCYSKRNDTAFGDRLLVEMRVGRSDGAR